MNRHFVAASLGLAGLLVTGLVAAQAPPRPAPPATGRAAQAPPPTAPAPGRTGQAPTAERPTLAQLMRGVMYPNSNILFAAQTTDPAEVQKKSGLAQGDSPFSGPYGGWQAVENAGIALSETAALIAQPRLCSNGRLAPVARADWQKYVRDLRTAAQVVTKAGQTKTMDAVLAAADKLTEACAACHDKFRDKPNESNRCLP